MFTEANKGKEEKNYKGLGVRPQLRKGQERGVHAASMLEDLEGARTLRRPVVIWKRSGVNAALRPRKTEALLLEVCPQLVVEPSCRHNAELK